MITKSAVVLQFAKLHVGNSRPLASTASADRTAADARFLYVILWGLVTATLMAGAVAAGLVAALASGPLQS